MQSLRTFASTKHWDREVSATSFEAGNIGGSASQPWAFGQVQGRALRPDGLPVLGATIALRRVSGESEQNAISGQDGSFAIGHVAPGLYEATAVANGYAESHADFLEITPGASLHTDLQLEPNADQALKGTAPSVVAAPPAPSPERGFFTRLGHAYLDDWTVDSNGSPAAPEPARRGTPRPLNSPPMRTRAA